MQIANAVKLVSGTGTCKVQRTATNIRDEKVERDIPLILSKNRSKTDD